MLMRRLDIQIASCFVLIIFLGRIHFCHQYEDLSSEARKSIWKSFLDKTEQDDSVRAAYTMEELESLASLDFNGRQVCLICI